MGTLDIERSDHAMISSDRVEGTTVYSPDGAKLGAIDELMIDKVSGKVRYAVLTFGGFLGMGADKYPLPWSMLTYSTDLDGYVVPVTEAMLEKAPRYAGEAPEYDSAYGKSIHTHYGKPWSDDPLE
ncbi:PRC-barrel domain-containing protein [soil metagenome]